MSTIETRKCKGITSRRLFMGALLVGFAVAPGIALAQAGAKLKVVASFTILADITRQVAGERATVTSLVGPNGDAHVYRATPADAKTLREADIVVVNGLGFEGFMPRLIASSGTKASIVTATKGLKPLEIKASDGHGHGHSHGHSHGKHDPHAWQSIDAVKLFVANIRDGLIARDPAGTETYKANATTYLASLDALKSELNGLIAAIPPERRVIVTNHDAFGYFGRDFGFRMEAVQGISTESEPSARDVARIIRIVKEKRARAVFVENMTDPRIGEQLAKETGAKLGGTLYSDALTDEKGPAPTYLALMRHNATMLAAALKD